MRLSKRLAVGVLAAVMALSMLTACGGGNANENPSSSGSNAPSNSSSSASSGSNSSSSSSPASSDSNSQNQVTAVSRTDKYFKRLGVDPDKSYYYELETLNGASGGSLTTQTSDGVRVGRIWKLKGIDSADLRIYDRRTKEEWCVYNNYPWGSGEDKERVEWEMKGTYFKGWPLIEIGTPVKATTHKVNGVEYYAEEVMLTNVKNQPTYYYCFDLNDTEGMNLRYIVEPEDYGKNSDKVLDVIYKFNAISGKANMNMLRVPEGYKLYKVSHVMGVQDEYMGTTPKDNYPN